MEEAETPRTWGDFQKKARDALGWSQIDLAKNSGVSERSLKRYEAGGSPQGEQVFLILSALGFPTPEDKPRAVNAILASMDAKLSVLLRTAGYELQGGTLLPDIVEMREGEGVDENRS